MLDLKGRVVTVDAMGCQREIASVIVERKGGYMLQIKGNQPMLLELAEQAFAAERPLDRKSEGIKVSHGRIESRTADTLDAVAAGVDPTTWTGAKTLVRVRATRAEGEKISGGDRYYLTTLPADDAEDALARSRGHWAIENTLHWSLDMTFGDDTSRVRKANAAENLSRLKRLALSLLKHAKPPKKGMSLKRFRTACDRDPSLLAKVMLGQV
jgi:predicted transposase YbfD/YdcC